MDEVHKQILENQQVIMNYLGEIFSVNYPELVEDLQREFKKTTKLVHPESEKESKALSKERDVLMGNNAKTEVAE